MKGFLGKESHLYDKCIEIAFWGKINSYLSSKGDCKSVKDTDFISWPWKHERKL